jgi:ABC-type oligopeptide transport system substrate-binding subunit
MQRCGQLTIALSIALCACGPADAPFTTSGSAADGVVLPRRSGDEPDTLNAHRNERSTGANILRDLYEGLMTEPVDARIVPGTAEWWTITDDRLVYTFSQRRDARWSNGHVELRRYHAGKLDDTNNHLARPYVRGYRTNNMNHDYSRQMRVERNSH